MSVLLLRLRGLLASLMILAFAVGTPIVLPRIDGVPSFRQFTWASLTAPDDGTLLLEVIKVLAWVFWAIFAFSVLLAIPAEIRGIRAPRIPGLALPQGAARQLVATAALAFTTIPTSHIAAVAQPVQAAPIALVDDPTPVVDPARDHVSEPPSRDTDDVSASAAQSDVPTKLHTVQRGESLWKIAEKYLGDGSRYSEIRDLNPAVLGDDLDFLQPGVILRVPAPPADPPTDETYVVQPGDTLSEIAAEELGDGQAYETIADASRHTIQPDGAHLTDPDLIRPGWRLTIPDGGAPTAGRTRGHPKPPAHSGPQPQPGSAPSSAPTTSPPRSTASPPVTSTPPVSMPSPTATRSATAGSAQQPRDNETSDTAPSRDSVAPSWVLPGLTGAGALLAASLLVIVRQHRRTQLRHRRPGHMIAPPGVELLPVAKTIQLAEDPALRRIEGLDRLLRTLPVDDPPPLRTLDIGGDDAVNLHLTEPAELGSPWHGDGREWSAPLGADVEVGDRSAAYPLLVTLGEDAEGRLWFLNLAQVAAVTITGDQGRSESLLRFIAIELATNRWSSRACVDLLGIGAEVSALDPDRLRHHPDDDTAFLDWLASDLDQSEDDSGLAPDQHHVLATTAAHRSAAESILETIARRRAGAAVIMIARDDCAPLSAGAVLSLSPTGELHAPDLGLTLHAVGLTAEEATVSTALIEATRTAVNTDIPVHEHPTNPIDAVTDRGGAVRQDLVEPRPRDPSEPAGPESNLQGASAAYETVAATSDQDVRSVAPVVPKEISSEVLLSDQDLDKHLKVYVDPDARVPKLTLLGPVNARCYGRPLVNRKPFFIELLAFLVLHPEGVTAARVAEAFHTSAERIHTDVGILRKWLGDDPITGQKYLPNAKSSDRPADNGKGIYQVHGVLCDLDLFRRLRARGQARGADGIEDLIAAFDLVTGEPFSEGRAIGWGWLNDDLTDTISNCAVVDVAHVIITHALAVKDHDLAWRTAEKIVAIAPSDDIARLDAIQVAAATGHANLAVQQLIDEVYNRSDDDLGPIELPDRAKEIIERHHLDKMAHARRARD